MKDDSIEGIYDTLKQCALVSKSAGGIGLAVSCIRATGSYIAGVTEILSVSLKANPLFFWLLMVVFAFQTNGKSNGLVPMLRVYNNTARYVDQGGNKVRGSKQTASWLRILEKSFTFGCWTETRSVCCVPGAVAFRCV